MHICINSIIKEQNILVSPIPILQDFLSNVQEGFKAACEVAVRLLSR
jgi:hypothetical protein